MKWWGWVGVAVALYTAIEFRRAVYVNVGAIPVSAGVSGTTLYVIAHFLSALLFFLRDS